jgi:hypothetical protein
MLQEGEPYVDGHGSLPAGVLDQGRDLGQQVAGFWALQIQILFRHPYPFTVLTRCLLLHGSWINTQGGVSTESSRWLHQSVPPQ